MNYKIDNIKDYKQFDTRWGKLSYRVLPACMRLNGCGATSVADIVYALNKKTTPKGTRKWLLAHGYVSANQGTYWAGIPAAMRAFGFTSVKRHATMSELFTELAKGNRAGVILFRKGTRGGRTYTTSGHFCGICGYKKVGSKHYLYIMDPGPRNNDGWICYEKEMYGLVVEVWSGKIPKKKTKKPVKVETNAEKIAKTATALAYKGAPDKAKYPTGRPTRAYKKALNKAYPKRSTWRAATKAGASCDVFAGTVMRESGVDSKFPRKLSEDYEYLEKSKKFKEIKKPTDKKLKSGDIIIYKRTEKKGHICFYADGKIKHAAYNKWYGRTTDNVKKILSTKNKLFVKVYRPK